MCMSIVRVAVRRGSSCQTCERISSRETGLPALRASQASNAVSRTESLHRRPPRWQISPRTQSTAIFHSVNTLTTTAIGRVFRLGLLRLVAQPSSPSGAGISRFMIPLRFPSLHPWTKWGCYNRRRESCKRYSERPHCSWPSMEESFSNQLDSDLRLCERTSERARLRQTIAENFDARSPVPFRFHSSGISSILRCA